MFLVPTVTGLLWDTVDKDQRIRHILLFSLVGEIEMKEGRKEGSSKEEQGSPK
jgi:hypothetical protein